MSPSTQVPVISITTPLGPKTFAVTAFSGREAVSELFEFTVDVSAPSTTAVAFDRLLGQGVTVSLQRPDAPARLWHGLVRSVAEVGVSRINDDVPQSLYRFVIIPALWKLTRTRRSRVFQHLSVPDILKKVLTGIDATVSLQGTYEPRNYCTQYRESDFAFASRLMEEEGIYYFFTHADGSHKLVLADSPSAHAAVAAPARVTYEPWEGGVRPADSVYTWEKEQRLTSGKVALWDHHFELPGKNLQAESLLPDSVTVGKVSHKLKVGGNDAMELYDYPGGYAKRFDGVATGGGDSASDVQKIFQDNVRVAKLRVGAEEAGALRLNGRGTCRQFIAGHKFTLDSPQTGASGSYVLLEVEHVVERADTGTSGDGTAFNYKNRFTCIPAALPFRPEQRTPRPTVAGCQTAVVVGPAGEEIFVDKYGRVKVQFHWDREGKKDANSSCWVRVATLWAGRKWGVVHTPRIGQEVVVDFVEGDPDRPIVVGSVYNADQMPPYVLPENKTQSGIKSRSSKEGSTETYNEFRFEDKKGAEHILLHAEKDLMVEVENHRTTSIGGDCTTDLVAKPTDSKTKGEGHQTLTIHKGNQTTTLKEGNQTVTLDKGNQVVTLTKGNQTIAVDDGNRTLTVNGNEETTVTKGNRKLTVADGNETLVIQKGNQSLAIKMGNEDISLDMGNYTLTVKMGNVSIKANLGSITLEAMQGVTLKCGQSSVKVDQMGVTVKGMMTKVEGTVMTEVKGMMTQVKGDAMLMAKGGITMIN